MMFAGNKFRLVHQREHGLAGDIAAGFPKRLTRVDDARRLPFELEEHFAFQHVTERRTARVPVRRGARAARRIADHHGHRVGVSWDERWLHLLDDGQRVLPPGVVCLRHRIFLSTLVFQRALPPSAAGHRSCALPKVGVAVVAMGQRNPQSLPAA
jgi:hypothetical protein